MQYFVTFPHVSVRKKHKRAQKVYNADAIVFNHYRIMCLVWPSLETSIKVIIINSLNWVEVLI